MKRFKTHSLSGSVFEMKLIGVLLFLCLSPLAFGDPASLGILGEVQGASATIHRGAVVTPAVAGLEVFAGDSIATLGGSSASVELKDGTIVTLGPESELVLRALKFPPAPRYAALEVNRGIAHFIVYPVYSTTSPFYVKTSTAAIGVKGTEFMVETSESGTSLHTFEGSVAFGKSWKDLGGTSAVIVKAGRSSSMAAKSSTATPPRVFNQKSFFENLKATRAGFTEQVETQRQKFASEHPEIAKAKASADLKEAARAHRLRRSKAKQ